MNLNITTQDPLRVLSSTQEVVYTSKYVKIIEENLGAVSQMILARFGKGLNLGELGFTETGSIEKDLQLVFIEDAVNFCFWADKDMPKWQVELEDGRTTEGGWFGLQACFERALKKGTPIIDAQYLSFMTLEDGKKFFQGVNSIDIPLLEERIKNLNEVGRVLLEKFDGQFMNVVEFSDYDAVKLVSTITENFPCFRDISHLDNKEIFFLKRSQICANDVDRLLKSHGRSQGLNNIHFLTAFADYKLPQLLRMLSVLEYSKELADKIDNYENISHDSREEIEIRATTVWAVELIRQRIPNLTACDIDNTIWLMSQDIQNKAKPYHRTRTLFY